MNLIDIGIILIILMGGVIGFKQGAIRKLISIIGAILVLVLSYKLKNYISPYLYRNLPFVGFLLGKIKGAQIVNIILYELIAFSIIAGVLGIIYNVLLRVTGILENILKATVILSIPSKIIGFFIGLIEEYIWVFVILVILSLPAIDFEMIKDSKVANFILNNSPILTKTSEETLTIYNGIYDIIKSDGEISNAEVNKRSLILMLDNKMITVESIDILIEKNKIELKETQFLDKYREEE